MPKVYPAEPYQAWRLGSMGDAKRMLINQSEFPDTYDERDKLIAVDHDRLLDKGYTATIEAFKRHTGLGEQELWQWLREDPSHGKVIAFIKDVLGDVLGTDRAIPWTGYRILGGVNQGNGCNVWTFELFAKHPDSQTIVYSGTDAPNVLPGPRH